MATHPDSDWKSVQIHVMDFEGNRGAGVVEYGVVTIEGGEIVQARSEFCLPKGRIPRREQELHGISNKDVEGTAPLSEHWEYFAELRQTGPLGAHHAAVEEGLLKQQWSHPRMSPDFLNSGQQIAEWGPWLDTKELYSTFFPSLPSFSLSKIIQAFDLSEELEKFGEKFCPPERKQYHAALYDAIASAVLLINLAKFPELASRMTIGWLLINSLPSSAKKQAAQQTELF